MKWQNQYGDKFDTFDDAHFDAEEMLDSEDILRWIVNNYPASTILEWMGNKCKNECNARKNVVQLFIVHCMFSFAGRLTLSQGVPRSVSPDYPRSPQDNLRLLPHRYTMRYRRFPCGQCTHLHSKFQR